VSRKIIQRVAVGLLVAVAGGALVIACGGGGDDEDAADSQPAATQAPAAAANLILDLDTVRGSTGIPTEQRATKSCVQASKIPVGGQVVWRIKVFDPRTGKEMDDKALTSVQVTLADGQVLTAKYGGHPGSAPIDYFWATSWNVPATYPTGAVDYKVVAKDQEGRTGEWSQFKVDSAKLQIVATDPLAKIDGINADLVASAR
jgi:hypothetical protein